VVVIVAAAVVGNTVVSTLTHLHLLVVSTLILIHTDPSVVNTLTLMDLGDMDLVVVAMEPLVASTLILMVLGVVALGVVSTLTPSLAMRP